MLVAPSLVVEIRTRRENVQCGVLAPSLSGLSAFLEHPPIFSEAPLAHSRALKAQKWSRELRLRVEARCNESIVAESHPMGRWELRRNFSISGLAFVEDF